MKNQIKSDVYKSIFKKQQQSKPIRMGAVGQSEPVLNELDPIPNVEPNREKTEIN